MFPAAKVAMADGEFSEFEKQNLVAALKEACQGNDLLMCEMYLEMCYLLNVDGEMLQELHTCMRTELDGKADVKLIVLELMISTAESDNGISEVEKQKIDEYDVLGRGMPNAKIHIKPFCINGKDIEQLGNGATLKYTYNGISFMFFFMGEDKRKELHVGERYKYKLELIGELNVNEYNGKLTNQIMVDKYEIIEYNNDNWEEVF